MPQDAFTLKYLTEELNTLFSGGKINKIIEPTSDEVVFTVYTGSRTERLFISVNPANPRIGITEEEKDSPLTAPNFCMLLRKHLLSATVDKISLVGFDRIVKIELTPTAEFFDAKKKVLFVELMGRYSNIILTEEGVVLGGNRGINFLDNGVRPLIVGKPYNFPPVGDKKIPSDNKLIEYFDAFSGEDLAKYLTDGVQGIATSTAKLIETEYNKEYPVYSGESFFRFLNGFTSRPANPCVYTENGKTVDVCAISYGYAMQEKFFDKLYLAENYYFTQKNASKRFEEIKQRLTSVVATNVKKIKKRLSAINARIKDAENAEDNKIKGDLIISNVYRIKRGDKSCVLENFYSDNEPIEISLDENLTPANNAENYYKKYNKQKRSLIALIPQKQTAEEELNYLSSVSDEIAIAETQEELLSVKSELSAGEYIPSDNNPKRKKVETLPYRLFDVCGFTVKAGRNNVENDRVTFSAKPDDIWLHAKDYHSSHLIIETGGKAVPEKVISLSAEICAYYSKGREGGKTEVVYTLKKFVKKPPKSKLGFCTYSEFKSITVNPARHDEFIK